MITRENYKDVLSMLDTMQWRRLANEKYEYVVLELHAFNVDSFVTIKLTNDFNRYQNVSNYGNAILEREEVFNDLNSIKY